MLILDLCGISIHPAVVVGLGNDLLFNSNLGRCENKHGTLASTATQPSTELYLLHYQR